MDDHSPIIQKHPISDNPLISVIIPCYNHGKYLEEAVLSVLNQTYKPVEIVIVDDGSTDPFTRNIYPVIEKKYPVKIVYQTNKGLPSARNEAIRNAKGELILPLDADDILNKMFIEKALQELKGDPEILAVSSWIQKFGIHHSITELQGGSLREFILDCPVMPAGLFRKSDWERIGGYDENMVVSYEDWEFWQRLLADGGRVYVIPEPLLNYQTHVSSLAVIGGEARYENMEYMVRKNTELYRRFPVETVLCSERLVKETKIKYRNMLDSVYHSYSYRLGHFLLTPFRIFKKRNRG